MKGLIVTRCRDCPFFQCYSSAGTDCTRHQPTRKIENGYDREISQNGVPSWCPLPEVEYKNDISTSDAYRK